MFVRLDTALTESLSNECACLRQQCRKPIISVVIITHNIIDSKPKRIYNRIYRDVSDFTVVVVVVVDSATEIFHLDVIIGVVVIRVNSSECLDTIVRSDITEDAFCSL